MTILPWETTFRLGGVAAWIHLEHPKQQLVAGWATPLKHMIVSWDDEIPNIWENKIDVPNHQPHNQHVGIKHHTATNNAVLTNTNEAIHRHKWVKFRFY